MFSQKFTSTISFKLIGPDPRKELLNEENNFIDYLLHLYNDRLSSDAIKEVQFYCNVGEFEKAFEGVMIEMMSENLVLNANLKKKIKKLQKS